MHPEFRKIYTTDVEEQRKRAIAYQQSLAERQSIEFTDPGDSMDKVNFSLPVGHVSSKFIPTANGNTLEVLRTIPKEVQTTIDHGAHFTLAENLEFVDPENGSTGTVIKSTAYIYIDLNRCILDKINSTGTRMIAPIPNGPAFLYANTPVGRNLHGIKINKPRTYFDLDGKERIVWVVEIDPTPDLT